MMGETRMVKVWDRVRRNLEFSLGLGRFEIPTSKLG